MSREVDIDLDLDPDPGVYSLVSIRVVGVPPAVVQGGGRPRRRGGEVAAEDHRAVERPAEHRGVGGGAVGVVGQAVLREWMFGAGNPLDSW